MIVIASAKELIQKHSEPLIAIRRHLHRNPELSGREFNTTRFLAAELEKESIPYRLGPDSRGIVVDLGNPAAEKRLAIRADMDAIAVHDTKEVEYRSTNNSVMHACGHDAHSSMLLGTVKALHELLVSEPTDLAIRAIFQPEEEIATGASRMIKFGVLEGVTAIIATHVDPTRDVGTIGLRSGVMTAHCNEISVHIRGRSGHAARPYETIDPVEIGSRFISECYQAVPRYDKSLPVVLSFTSFHGGDGFNVIPEHVELKGTMRSLEKEARENAVVAVKQIASQVSKATGAKIEVEFGRDVPSVVADESMTQFIREVGESILGVENVNEIPVPSMGGEDFAFYSHLRPASFIRLGCRGENIGDLPLHNSGFDIDEGVLTVGVDLMTNAALKFLQQD